MKKQLKLNKLFFLLITWTLVSLTSFKNDLDFSKKDISIRVVNQSSYKLKNIYLFSVKFNNLKINGKSEYKKLNFNNNSDDAMMYLKAQNKNFSFYVSPISQNGKYSFIIDSLAMDRGYIYMHKINK